MIIFAIVFVLIVWDCLLVRSIRKHEMEYWNYEHDVKFKETIKEWQKLKHQYKQFKHTKVNNNG